MLWLSIFLIILSAGGFLCEDDDDDSFKCYLKDIEKCDSDLIPQDFPDTVEELKKFCSNSQIFIRCRVNVMENCGHITNHTFFIKEKLPYIRSVCEEGNPIYEVISSNLQCVTPLARKVPEKCFMFDFSEEQYDTILSRLPNPEDDHDALRCIFRLWDIACPSVTIGHYCGPETKNALEDFLKNMSYDYYRCPESILQDADHYLQVFESIVEETFVLENVIDKRK